MLKYIKNNTYGRLLNNKEAAAVEFTERVELTDFDATNVMDRNAITHAHTSYDLTYRFGVTAARTLGWAKELWSGPNEEFDSVKDQYNNKIGQQVGEYANANNLSYEEGENMLGTILDAGYAAKYENDPRIFDERLPDLFGNTSGTNQAGSEEQPQLPEDNQNILGAEADAGAVNVPYRKGDNGASTEGCTEPFDIDGDDILDSVCSPVDPYEGHPQEEKEECHNDKSDDDSNENDSDSSSDTSYSPDSYP